jgi:hypothetical protein
MKGTVLAHERATFQGKRFGGRGKRIGRNRVRVRGKRIGVSALGRIGVEAEASFVPFSSIFNRG